MHNSSGACKLTKKNQTMNSSVTDLLNTAGCVI